MRFTNKTMSIKISEESKIKIAKFFSENICVDDDKIIEKLILDFIDNYSKFYSPINWFRFKIWLKKAVTGFYFLSKIVNFLSINPRNITHSILLS